MAAIEPRVQCLSGAEDFAGLREDWEELLTESRSESIFLTHGWMTEWWRHYGSGLTLWTLTVQRQGRIIGILPLVLEKRGSGRRRVRFMGFGEVTPNHLDVVAAPDNARTVVKSAWNWLSWNRSSWDELQLEGLEGDSPAVTFLLECIRSDGFFLGMVPQHHCIYARLPSSFEDFLQNRGAKTRRQFRNGRRQFLRDHPQARLSDVTSETEYQEIFDAFLRLHRLRWRGRRETDSFTSPRLEAFHRAVSSWAFRTGRLRLYHIRVDDAVVAVGYCFVMGSRLIYYNGGFDGRIGRYSLGILTMAWAIESAIGEGLKECDFLQGETEFKLHWTDGKRSNLSLRAHPPHLRGRAFHLLWRLRETARRAVRTVLPRNRGRGPAREGTK